MFKVFFLIKRDHGYLCAYKPTDTFVVARIGVILSMLALPCGKCI